LNSATYFTSVSSTSCHDFAVLLNRLVWKVRNNFSQEGSIFIFRLHPKLHFSPTKGHCDN
jgi:hypothetical protein